MSKRKPLPSVEIIKSRLRYDPQTGKCFWLPRPVSDFQATHNRSPEAVAKWWNGRFAGKEAGSKQNNHYTCRINGKDYFLHRVIWVLVCGKDLDGDIDHINGDGFDNRLRNLREVEVRENTRNAKRRKDNRSGMTGVGYYAPKNMWRARINDNNGKTVTLGYFKTKEEAMVRRRQAEIRYGYHDNHGR